MPAMAAASSAGAPGSETPKLERVNGWMELGVASGFNGAGRGVGGEWRWGGDTWW
uniref:ETT n=1 Tax=Arundo donax TaxID=35708 RepID=A0A0A9ERK5_ARUDO